MNRWFALLLLLAVTVTGCATRNMNKEQYFKYLEDREDARADAAEANAEKDAEWAREDELMEHKKVRQELLDRDTAPPSDPD